MLSNIMDGLFMLTIKDNLNKISDEDLHFIANYILKFCKSEIIKYEFENGKQERKHIHCICKPINKHIPNILNICINIKYFVKYLLILQILNIMKYP
jgi:hypothetical protein